MLKIKKIFKETWFFFSFLLEKHFPIFSKQFGIPIRKLTLVRIENSETLVCKNMGLKKVFFGNFMLLIRFWAILKNRNESKYLEKKNCIVKEKPKHQMKKSSKTILMLKI
jgi:hypothetical protein